MEVVKEGDRLIVVDTCEWGGGCLIFKGSTKWRMNREGRRGHKLSVNPIKETKNNNKMKGK